MAHKKLQTIEFGKYRLLKMLSQGSSSEILLACNVQECGSKKFYVIKKLSDHIATNEEKLQAFVRECDIASSLSHENIVNGREYGTVIFDGKTSHYLAMDYVFGKNLAQLIKKSKDTQLSLPIDIVCSIIHSVAKGLNHAHNYCDPLTLKEQPVIHKDISPDNILISYNGGVQLSDFGISSKGFAAPPSVKIAGKWRFMSPEQQTGQTIDCRSDIYSLGIVLWECLTGMKIPITREKTEKNSKIPTSDIAPPIKVKVDTPIEISDICMRCLEYNPENRFQSAQALCTALTYNSTSNHWNTTGIKKILNHLFAEEFRLEATMLVHTQEKLQTNTSSHIESFPVSPTCNGEKSLKHLNNNFCGTESPSVKNKEQTKIVKTSDLKTPTQNFVQFSELALFLTSDFPQQSRLKEVVSSTDITQTDYSFPEDI